MVMDVMRNEASERHRVCGIGEPLLHPSRRRPVCNRRLPPAPCVSCLLPNHWVGIVQQSVVCRNDVVLESAVWDGGAKTFPIFGEKDGYSTTKQPVLLSARCRVLTPNKTMSVTRCGWVSA